VQDEFIEIVNASAASVNISGWTISDALTVRHVFPNGTILPANCGIVVWGGGTPIGQFGGMQKQVASVSPVNGLALNNDGDTVTLRDTSSLLVDSMSYTATTSGVSITRSPDLTGGFVLHTTAQAGVNFSPGKRVNLTTFGGCPPELLDSDNDGIPDVNDNCDFVANPFQQDCDNDGIGDACETDPDSNGNGIPDNCEIGVPGNVRINEIRIDETGTDNDEYFEIKGPANLSLNGLTLIVIGDGVAAAGSGVIEQVTSLNGKTIPADGHFLCAESTMTLVPLAQVDFVTTLNFENQDNVTFALVTNFNGLNGQDLDTNNDGVITRGEWHDSLATFRALDRNRDNRISRTEFRDVAGTSGSDYRQTFPNTYMAGYERGWTEGRAVGRQNRDGNRRWDIEGQRELRSAEGRGLVRCRLGRGGQEGVRRPRTGRSPDPGWRRS
jgi:hypothetical protein